MIFSPNVTTDSELDSLYQKLQKNPPSTKEFLSTATAIRDLNNDKKFFTRLKEHVPILFHRQWILTSLKGCERSLQDSIRTLRVKNHTEATQHYTQGLLWLGQAKQIYNFIQFFSNTPISSVKKKFRDTEHHIERGDIILSYKTRAYLKNEPLSRLVQFASNSPVTHALIAISNERALMSGDETNGIGSKALAPVPGEVLLCFKPERTISRAIISRRIDEIWNNSKQALLSKDARFPEMKCQAASAIGLVTIIGAYTKLPLVITNPLRSQAGFFCSELVDHIYRDFPLTPRSGKSIVGPIEFFYSPRLHLSSVRYHPADEAIIPHEIRSQFLG